MAAKKRKSSNEGKKAFSWTDEEVSLLLEVVTVYKTEKESKGLDWETVRSRYEDILASFLERYPMDIDPNDKTFPRSQDTIDFTKDRIIVKLKRIKTSFRKAIDSRRRSGGGRIVAVLYDECAEIWSESPAVEAMSNGLESCDISTNSYLGSTSTVTDVSDSEDSSSKMSESNKFLNITEMDREYERISEADKSETKAGLFSYLFFAWMNRLLKLGYKRPLTGDDLFELSDENKAQDLVNDLHELWMDEMNNAEKMGKKPRLWKAMWKLFPQDFILVTFLKMIDNSMQFGLAILVWFYLKFLEDSSFMDKIHVSVAIVAGIGIVSLVRVFCYHHSDYLTLSMGMRLKIALIGLIHKKITKSRRSDLCEFSSGQLVNLVSNDAKRMEELCRSLEEAITIPFVFIGVVLSLSLMIGWQSLSGLLMMFLLMAVILILSKVFANIRSKQAKVTDTRLAVMSEIISGIRAVKMYAWEWKYKTLVDKIRRKEINLNKQKGFLQSFFQTTRFTITVMASLVSITTLVYSEIRLYTVSVFTLATILEIGADCLANKIGFHLLNAIDAQVSISRIEEFLHTTSKLNDSLQKDTAIQLEKQHLAFSKSEISSVNQVSSTSKESPPLMVLSNMSASWTKDQRCVLHQVSLTVYSNQLLMVTGPVGSGKSSLLMAILGEIPTTKDAVEIHGSIAYASQIPWIFSGTIRDNIVFGRPFDEIRYNRILGACDLHKDIRCFPNGDLTIIGQRGVGLSGGQRARVSLARAVYSDADIFLLDDPLSAVDPRVGQHILEKCICGELSSRTRVLVTHQVQHLPRADQIAVVREGAVVLKTYSELKDEELLDIIEEHHTSCDLTSVKDILDSSDSRNDNDLARKDMREDDEDRDTGTVPWRLYWQFLIVGLPPVVIGCLFLFYIICQASMLSPSWWMSRIAHMSLEQQKSSFSLGIFGGLVGGAFVLSLAKDMSFFCTLFRSTRKLHDKMALAVIKSPVLFFDTNPVGRIMNRFSKDVGAMDDLLPIQFSCAFTVFLHVVVVVVFAVVVNVWIIVVVISIGVLFSFITQYYLKSSRELKRMEAIRCSPVYDYVTETIRGLEVIRTSNMGDECCDVMSRLQNEHTKAFFLVMATARWFGLFLDLLYAFFLVGVATVGLFAIEDHALAGLLLSLSITFFGAVQYGMRMASEVESQMTSVERVMTYTKLPSEPGYSRHDKPPEDWPSQGALSLQDMSMVYLEGGPLVLKDVNLDVKPKEKIGIAGRTGAGKSSLVAALFRMPDPQGQVVIDGVDLGTINIQAARRSMAVITQDPMLFTGSLKKNLDPFNYFTDEAIWTALEEVQLKKKVDKLDQQLEFCVGEGGSGFSVGERQLLCLARALLQKCKILVLDEATANVDYETDQLIQQVIRQKFSNCTVLTIAHRLNTIMDYDKVVVLDQGHVVEYDNPRVLASKENGFFSRLISGKLHQESS